MNESIERLELFLAHNLPELVLYLSGPIVMFVYLLTVSAPLALVSILPLLLVAVVMAVMFTRFYGNTAQRPACVSRLPARSAINACHWQPSPFARDLLALFPS